MITLTQIEVRNLKLNIHSSSRIIKTLGDIIDDRDYLWEDGSIVKDTRIMLSMLVEMLKIDICTNLDAVNDLGREELKPCDFTRKD